MCTNRYICIIVTCLIVVVYYHVILTCCGVIMTYYYYMSTLGETFIIVGQVVCDPEAFQQFYDQGYSCNSLYVLAYEFNIAKSQ